MNPNCDANTNRRRAGRRFIAAAEAPSGKVVFAGHQGDEVRDKQTRAWSERPIRVDRCGLSHGGLPAEFGILVSFAGDEQRQKRRECQAARARARRP